MQTFTKRYIDGAFVESHGREVMDGINPTNGKMIGKTTRVEALHAAELPKGVCSVVIGLGGVVGAELVRNPDVTKISTFDARFAAISRHLREKRWLMALCGTATTRRLDGGALTLVSQVRQTDSLTFLVASRGHR
jgi:acyl-CoA reductase-like NAD-dependent aldehyde dehydrogenase